MRMLPSVAGFVATVCCLSASAQDVPPPPAPAAEVAPAAPAPVAAQEGEPAPAPVPVPAPAAALAPAPAPAPVPASDTGWNLRPVDPQTAAAADAEFPQGNPVEDRQLRRQLRRHQKEVARLERVMQIEGNEFSEEKFETYRSRKAGGITLVAIGGASLVFTLIYGFYVCMDSISDNSWYDDDDDTYEPEGDGRFAKAPQRAALWIAFATGLTGIAVGVPLLVSGSRGKKRQELLRRKEEILAPFDPATASLSLFADPHGGGGGLRLEVRF